MNSDLIGLALTLLYALLCIVFLIIWARPALLRHFGVTPPRRIFARARIERLRDLWRDLALSASGLAVIAYEEDAFAASLGLLMLALFGLAARAIGDDILANGGGTGSDTGTGTNTRR